MRFVLIFTLISLLAGAVIDIIIGETRAEQIVGFAYVMIAVGILLFLFVGIAKFLSKEIEDRPLIFSTLMFVLVMLSYNSIQYFAFGEFPTWVLLKEGLKMDFEVPQISHFVVIGSYLIATLFTYPFRKRYKKIND